MGIFSNARILVCVKSDDAFILIVPVHIELWTAVILPAVTILLHHHQH